jgi:hypothetical protein
MYALPRGHVDALRTFAAIEVAGLRGLERFFETRSGLGRELLWPPKAHLL